MNRTFEWISARYSPGAIEYPILCWTENDRLMTFKNTWTYNPHNRTEKISNWEYIVRKFKVKYWVYQNSLINNPLYDDYDD